MTHYVLHKGDESEFSSEVFYIFSFKYCILSRVLLQPSKLVYVLSV